MCTKMMSGQELKGIRLALGLSLRQLAPKLNTSHTTLDRVERGTVDVPRAMERQARDLAASLSHPPAAPITEVRVSILETGSSGTTIRRADGTSTTFVVAPNMSIRIVGSDVILEPVDLMLLRGAK